jgi:hypothetical protein
MIKQTIFIISRTRRRIQVQCLEANSVVSPEELARNPAPGVRPREPDSLIDNLYLILVLNDGYPIKSLLDHENN